MNKFDYGKPAEVRQEIRNRYARHLEWLNDNRVGEPFDVSTLDMRDLEDVLTGLDLRDSILLGLYGPHAMLQGINFEGADMSRVYLKDAVLEGSNLTDVVLEGADLRGVDMRGVVLKGANLRRADFDGANMAGCVLGDADIDGAFINYPGFDITPFVRDPRTGLCVCDH